MERCRPLIEQFAEILTSQVAIKLFPVMLLVSPARLRRYPMLAGVGATVAFIGLGCSGSASLGPVRPEASIDSFITSQALVHPSSPKIRLEVDHPHVTFFDVSFGTPFQCDLDHQPVMCQL